MIKLEKKQQIIIKRQMGSSEREISRELGISRTTVRKYIKKYENKKQELLEKGEKIGSEELITEIVEKPKYDTRNRKKVKMTQEIIKEIKGYLEGNKIKKRNGLHKQIMKIKDIHENLEESGYDIGYTSVRNVIREIESKENEVYIKQNYIPGEVAEFDWGEVKLEINGKLKKLQMSAFVLAYSGYRYMKLYPKQNTESFLDSHASFYEHIGRVNSKNVYDNMKVAIKRFVGSEREPTEEFLKLSIYYGFRYRFCNVRKPNEKGHVERNIEYIRRKAFSKRIAFKSIEEANKHLEETLLKQNSKKRKAKNGKSNLELLEEEKQYMKVKPVKYETGIMKYSKPNKYSTIKIDSNYYSVPEKYSNKLIGVKLYPNKIILYSDNKKIGYHNRTYESHKYKLKIEHYTKTLIKKPGALAGSTALHQAQDKIKHIYKNYFSTKPKEFIMLIQLMNENKTNLEEIEKAIKTLEKINSKDISLDKIKILIDKNNITSPQKIKENEIERLSRNQLSQLNEMMI